jgi:curved DNA-binding protein CbpA
VKNYYEVLGIEKTADAQQIKRAYFALVRQYPPERFPEEFKELRAAYETLSSDKKRAEYDDIGALPDSIAPLFWQAQEHNCRGRHSQASDLYRTILKLYPDLIKIRAEYARSLDAEGKSGLALKVWEALCKQEPSNALYVFRLAISYEERGWNKKAAAQYWRALDIDSANAECWSSLINYSAKDKDPTEAKKLCRQALEAVREKDSGTIYLYAYAFLLCAEDDTDAAEECLKNILRLMRSGRQTDEREAEKAVFELVSLILAEGPGLIRFFPSIQQMADLLPHIGEDLRDRLAQAKRFFEIENLEEKGFPDLFHDLLTLRNLGAESRKMHYERLGMEFALLKDRDAYRSQLLRLQRDYPYLYDLHEAFFNEALRTHNLEKMMHQRSKEVSKYMPRLVGYMDGEEEEEEDWDGEYAPQTVRREEPKTGRNDPCPCGSGKKYKKCCGA